MVIVFIELLFIAMSVVYRLRGNKVKQANRWGKIKMILQCTAVGLVLLGLLIDYPVLISGASFVFGGAIVFAVMSLFSHGV